MKLSIGHCPVVLLTAGRTLLSLGEICDRTASFKMLIQGIHQGKVICIDDRLTTLLLWLDAKPLQAIVDV